MDVSICPAEWRAGFDVLRKCLGGRGHSVHWVFSGRVGFNVSLYRKGARLFYNGFSMAAVIRPWELNIAGAPIWRLLLQGFGV